MVCGQGQLQEVLRFMSSAARGGSASVCISPCTATVTPAICVFYTRLGRRSKPRKMVLVAAMRKLLLTLNMMVRDQVPWLQAPVSKPIEA